MKIPQPIVMTASAGVSTIAGAYLQQSLEIMVPWLIATFSVIVADGYIYTYDPENDKADADGYVKTDQYINVSLDISK